MRPRYFVVRRRWNVAWQFCPAYCVLSRSSISPAEIWISPTLCGGFLFLPDTLWRGPDEVGRWTCAELAWKDRKGSAFGYDARTGGKAHERIKDVGASLPATQTPSPLPCQIRAVVADRPTVRMLEKNRLRIQNPWHRYAALRTLRRQIACDYAAHLIELAAFGATVSVDRHDPATSARPVHHVARIGRVRFGAPTRFHCSLFMDRPSERGWLIRGMH